MAKKLLGIEIGNRRLKIAVCDNYNLQSMIIADIPDNLVREGIIVSWEAMADFIKETVSENGLNVKNAAVVLPDQLAFSRRITMPLMTVDQLKVNLPFEFHDYITEDMDKYYYDYSVIEKIKDEEGNVKEIDMMAVAASKSVVEQYQNLMRRAGLKLVLIAPSFVSYKNIIKDYEEAVKPTEKKDYVILDLGHRGTRMHFFAGGEFEVTRAMEPGCDAIDRFIAESLGVDEHIAQIYKESNKDEILISQGCIDIYNEMAVEIMRVLNFYNYNHPGNNLDKIYYCGGGSLIKPLIAEISSAVEVDMAEIQELLTDKYDDTDKLVSGLQALGITWE